MVLLILQATRQMTKVLTAFFYETGKAIELCHRLAKNTSRSKSWLAADAISLYLDTQEWQIGEIESGIRDADMENFAPVDELAAFFTKWSDGS